MKDLSYYEAAIQSYFKHKIRDPEEETKLLTPVLGIIKSLREVCVGGVNHRDTKTQKSFDLKTETVERISWEITFQMYLMNLLWFIQSCSLNRENGENEDNDFSKVLFCSSSFCFLFTHLTNFIIINYWK